MKKIEKATVKRRVATKKLPKDIVINPDFAGKYDDQPFFQDKINRANYIVKTVSLPKFKN
jgi:hypothetical protein